MKKLKICSILMAMVMVTGMLMAGCKKSETSATADPSASDTGLSLNVDPDTTGSDTGLTIATAPMTFEDNFDAAAIAEMNKIVNVHGTQFSAVDYNFYFANEYAQMMSMYMYGQASFPVTAAGFLDMSGQLTPTKTVAQYLQELVVSDMQGEVFLLDYAKSKNLSLDDTVLKSIDDQFAETKTKAQSYNMTIDQYLQTLYGPEASEEALRAILQRYETINLAMKHYVEEYPFTESETKLPTVYHVLFPTVDLTNGGELPDDKKAEAKKSAEDFKAGFTDFDTLKTKADELKTAGTVAEASQYTVSRGQMVKEFEEWCFAPHQTGDLDIVQTQYGYHVMYFVEYVDADDDQKADIAYAKLQDEMEEAIQSGAYDPKFS